MKRPTLLDVNEWDRCSRGRGFEFIASDRAVAEVFADPRLNEFRPITLFTSTAIKNGRRYDWKTERFSDQEFLARRKVGDWKFFLSTPIAHPDFTLASSSNLDSVFSINGLVCLQHGLMVNGRRYRSSLSLVDKVASNRTNEVLLHEEAFRFWKVLKSALQRSIKNESVTA